MAAPSVVWSYPARADLFEALKYLAEESVEAAASLFADVEAAAESLNQFPDRGARVPEWAGRGLRQIFVRRYRLIYRVDDGTVGIVRLIHGSQDLRKAWERRLR